MWLQTLLHSLHSAILSNAALVNAPALNTSASVRVQGNGAARATTVAAHWAVGQQWPRSGGLHGPERAG